MTRIYFSALAEYNNWTDSLAIEWLRQINEEQWLQPIDSSFNSIRQTAVHIVSAKKIWIDFWAKATHPIYFSAVFDGTKNDLIAQWLKASADLKSVIENYPEEDYLSPVNFIYPNGSKGQLLFWQSVQHFVNHATYHRGQLVTLLRQVGFSNFSNTDLATFFIKGVN